MITELTAEQQARFPEFVEKWIKIGLCTDPADRPAAEEAVRLSYRIAGFDPPERIVWCSSPLAMTLARSMVHITTEDRTILSSLRESVAASVAAPVDASVAASVAASVNALVAASVYALVGTSVYALVGISVASLVAASDMHLIWSSSPRQYEVSWYAFYDYFRVVCGLTEQTEKLVGLKQITENAGWWSPHQDICWICERPNRIIRDDRGRLHCEDGPALSYPDGWSLYAIHGILVDEQVVVRPRSQDVDRIRKELDAEVKRVRIERFGWGEYLREVGAVVLNTRDNDVEATKEALMRTPDGHAVLVCACPSTARVYCLEVHPSIATCEGAQDWLSGGLSHRVINGA